MLETSTAEGREAIMRRMLLIREFDSKAGEIYEAGDIPGFVHLYIGQEACAVGACAALDGDDYITSTHRGHGHCIAKGLDPKHMMAELHGKAPGYCNGKGGSMHIADVEAGMLGANGIVGAGVPLATGAALSIDQTGEDRVALSFFGDGGMAQGQVHEGMNLAATWDLPAIYFIENNQYGEGTPAEVQHNIDKLSESAASYGIPGVTIDGMDVLRVAETVAEARERAIRGEGPTLIEAETYRYRGHSEGDPQDYRTEEEVEHWRKEHDPIVNFKETLEERGELTDEKFESIRQEIQTKIEESVAFAQDAAQPEPEEAYEDMFDSNPPEIEQYRQQMSTDGGETR